MFVRMSESYSSMHRRSNAIQAHHSLLQWGISLILLSLTLLIKAPPGLYLNNFEPSSANMDYILASTCVLSILTRHQTELLSSSPPPSPTLIRGTMLVGVTKIYSIITYCSFYLILCSQFRIFLRTL